MDSDVFFLEVYYSGHVQGVGFRYQTVQVAKEFVIRGDVMNLSDGRVLMRAEGDKDEVLAFQKELEDRMQHFIRETEVKSGMRAPECSGFVIRHE